MHELTSEEKENILLTSIKVARENLYTAEIHNVEQEKIDYLQSVVDSLETEYTEQFGE